jgi:hypothetical protein
MSDVSVKHAFHSPKADGPDTTKIRASNWNADLLFTGGTVGDILTRDTGSATGAAWTATPSVAGFTIPATVALKGPFLASYGLNTFAGTPDPTLYLGYNQNFNGTRVVGTEPGISWAIEADYNDGSGQNKAEAYLQYNGLDGVATNRPFAVQWNRTTNATSLQIQASSIAFLDNAGVQTAQQTGNLFVLTGPNAGSGATLDLRAVAGQSAYVNLGFNAVAGVGKIHIASANELRIDVGPITPFYLFGYSGLQALAIGAQDNGAAGTFVVGASHTNGIGLVARGRSGQTGDLIQAQTSTPTVVFKVSPTGAVTAAAGFGCNGAAAQTSVASGGALAAYVTGAFGLDSTAHMQALFNQVVAIRAALVANGIMS